MSFLADLIDNVGTALGANELGISEWLNGGNKTSNTRASLSPIQGFNGSLGSNAWSSAINQNNPNNVPYPARVGGSTGTTGAANTGESGTYDPYNIYGSAGGGGGAAYSGPTYDPNVLAQYDQGINQLQSGLDRLGNQLGIAQANVNTQYSTNKNELDSTRNSAQQSYNTSTTQNSQNLRSNKNTINDQASSGLRGLLRMLGAYGAVGSDTDQAGKAVADQASMQRAGAGQTFAQNQQSLDTNWNNFTTEDDNNRKKLEDWKSNQLRSVEAQSESTRQSLLSQLADAMGKRAAYKGGSYAGGAQPYLDQASALNGKIDELGRMNPTYNGTRATYTPTKLDSYLTGSGTAAKVDPSALMNSDSPLLQTILSAKDKQKQTLL